MSDARDHDDNTYKQLKHRFAIEPVTEARMKMLRARSHPGAYQTEKVPDHILKAVTVLDETDDKVLLQGPHDTLWMPKPMVRPNWFSMSRGYARHLLNKYAMKDVLRVKQRDVVVDCGAFVGGFALAAAERAARVIAVEPAPISFDCLQLNTADASNITCVQAGLLDKDGTAKIAVRPNPTDNSFLRDEADSTTFPDTVEVPVLSLPSLMEQQELDHIDMLKLEAEGLELEILDTVTPKLVSRIAIDAGPERGGMSPFLDLAVLLASRGYHLANRNYWLYAVSDE